MAAVCVASPKKEEDFAKPKDIIMLNAGKSTKRDDKSPTTMALAISPTFGEAKKKTTSKELLMANSGNSAGTAANCNQDFNELSLSERERALFSCLHPSVPQNESKDVTTEEIMCTNERDKEEAKVLPQSPDNQRDQNKRAEITNDSQRILRADSSREIDLPGQQKSPSVSTLKPPGSSSSSQTPVEQRSYCDTLMDPKPEEGPPQTTEAAAFEPRNRARNVAATLAKPAAKPAANCCTEVFASISVVPSRSISNEIVVALPRAAKKGAPGTAESPKQMRMVQIQARAVKKKPAKTSTSLVGEVRKPSHSPADFVVKTAIKSAPGKQKQLRRATSSRRESQQVPTSAERVSAANYCTVANRAGDFSSVTVSSRAFVPTHRVRLLDMLRGRLKKAPAAGREARNGEFSYGGEAGEGSVRPTRSAMASYKCVARTKQEPERRLVSRSVMYDEDTASPTGAVAATGYMTLADEPREPQRPFRRQGRTIYF